MAEVTDEELREAALRVRRHARRSAFAKLMGVACAVAAIVLAVVIRALLPDALDDAFGTRILIGMGALGVLGGAFVNNRLAPADDPLED
ncbi:MAG TPA: hypothetical protein RMH99_08960 [Sandaracinaceae bacterium LLY-WYZ-13_1]|nr:hypothetical protein [Sandaracinaceae bacterium LLY-WYZ-13_1]